MTVPTVLFASGTGSNVGALLEACRTLPAAWHPALLVSDREDAPVLDLARAHELAAVVVPPGEDFEARLLEVLDDVDGEGRPALLVLAGYLRLVPAGVVDRFSGRILNVHPSLLPAFGGRGMYGRRIHEAVLARGVQVTGATVHLVDEHFDAGPILAQWPVPVHAGDTPETLAARVLATEHRLYPLVVDHVARALEQGAEPTPLPPDSSSRPTRSGLVFP
ncbi:MAG: phosphoribosylglycinamide formyltransferase [Gemmatimonadales bacterium]|nr:MAG: phosphoribosylglycinamide formyltransferase [Gemmatimonadales bacterium]